MLTFHVPGKPVPQGSKRWLPNGAMIEANPNLRPWRQAVTLYAVSELRKHGISEPLDEPVLLSCEFTFARPKAHYGTGKNSGRLKPNAPLFMPSVPDVDKLVRAVQDALTDARVWRDDAQVVTLQANKRYDEQAGATITVYSYREMFKGRE